MGEQLHCGYMPRTTVDKPWMQISSRKAKAITKDGFVDSLAFRYLLFANVNVNYLVCVSLFIFNTSVSSPFVALENYTLQCGLLQHKFQNIEKEVFFGGVKWNLPFIYVCSLFFSVAWLSFSVLASLSKWLLNHLF